MKNLNIVDKVFLGLGAFFSVLSIYELIKFLIPLYTYPRALLSFFVLAFAYLTYRNWLTVKGIYQEHLSQKTLRVPLKIKALWSGKMKNNSEKNIISQQSHSDTARIKNINIALSYIVSWVSTVKNNIQLIGYGLFILTFIWTVASILSSNGTYMPYICAVFFVLYIVIKFFGFSLDYEIQKSKLRNGNSFRFFLIVFAVYIISLSSILDVFSVEDELKNTYYLSASAIYLALGYAIFFFRWFSFYKRFSLYNLLSLILIACLVSLLVFKYYPRQEQEEIQDGWNTSDTAQEQFDLENIIAEPIISDEVILQTESVLISSQYDIADGLRVWSQWEEVEKLQDVLTSLSFYTGSLSGQFDETTRVWLRNALIASCDWPESTQWIFGPLAKECIDNLEILVPIN